jgi:hypothetical protein
MSEPEGNALPPMSDAVLDDEQLAALFRDYRQCAGQVQIVVKLARGFVPAAAPRLDQPSLDEAEELLRTRLIRGLQVRYQHDQALWYDTLMPLAEGVRLVRIPHPADGQAALSKSG